jgi:selenocysteine-specific elongation factor
MTVVATAGHVDHGKSTLVKTLTGTDPDRWAEEKARGLTIDIGFAATALASGRVLSLVDVPGHERFIRNMLAGVGAVDACIFVVAANEGWKPQSEEHLRILELLGLRHGVVALTKAALVDDDMRQLATWEIDDKVAGTFLEGAPVIAVDALTGAGMDELVAAVEQLLATVSATPDIDRPRLWIDRVFAARGAGTVVTGTLTGGTLRVDDELLVLPRSTPVRIRGLQSHFRDEAAVAPGTRVAVNLTGVSHDQVQRGHVLVRSRQWHRSARADATLRVLESLDHDVSRRGAYLAYVGSGEHPVKVRILGPSSLSPGADGLVRLHLATPLPLVMGDRFVLRESGRAETVGGGEILDVEPVVAASRARPDRSVDRIVAERGYIEPEHLERLTGERRAPTLGRWVVSAAARAATEAQVDAAIAAAGPLGLDVATLDERARAVLEARNDIVQRDGRATLADAADPLADHPFVAALVAGGFTPPDPEGVDRGELRELVRRGLVVDEGGVYFAAPTVQAAAELVARLLRERPGGVTVAEVREAMGTSRKYAMPLLARLDATGVTRRRDDVRVGGPRLPHV